MTSTVCQMCKIKQKEQFARGAALADRVHPRGRTVSPAQDIGRDEYGAIDAPVENDSTRLGPYRLPMGTENGNTFVRCEQKCERRRRSQREHTPVGTRRWRTSTTCMITSTRRETWSRSITTETTPVCAEGTRRDPEPNNVRSAQSHIFDRD